MRRTGSPTEKVPWSVYWFCLNRLQINWQMLMATSSSTQFQVVMAMETLESRQWSGKLATNSSWEVSDLYLLLSGAEGSLIVKIPSLQLAGNGRYCIPVNWLLFSLIKATVPSLKYCTASLVQPVLVWRFWISDTHVSRLVFSGLSEKTHGTYTATSAVFLTFHGWIFSIRFEGNNIYPCWYTTPKTL